MSAVPPLYKFLTAEQASPTGSGRWTPGEWRSVSGVLVPCKNGLHATTADNLLPFLDAQLWRVEIGDEHVWHTDDSVGRKLVARRMRVTERVEAWTDRTARLFAADCAERVLPIYERQQPVDERPRRAIEVARRFANGDATRDELNAAGDAAWAAARDAARAAARAAAWDAAWAAARDAARDAAWDAERQWQARRLGEMLGLTAETGGSL